jgi:alkylresorcinol/alkylpyrone synthase
MSLQQNPEGSLESDLRSSRARVVSLATSAPKFSISQEDACLIAQELGLSERWNHALPALYRKSGVQRRGSVLLNSEEGNPCSRQMFYRSAGEMAQRSPSTQERMGAYSAHAGDLLHEACEKALQDSGIAPFEVTHLVTISCTGFFSPGVDFEMISRCGLSPSVQRTHIGFMGCHAALNGLNVARSIAGADPSAVVMVGAVELCSLHQQYTDDPQQLVANALFADGAACMIVSTNESLPFRGRESSDAEFCVHSQNDWTMRSHCSHWIPKSNAKMSWTIGNHGFEMTLDPQVPSIIEECLFEVVQNWLELEGLSISDIDGWAIHPGGPRIVQSAGKALNLNEQDLAESLGVLSNYGNMSSPTVLFILEKLLSRSNDHRAIVMLAFGPGLCVEASLLTREA